MNMILRDTTRKLMCLSTRTDADRASLPTYVLLTLLLGSLAAVMPARAESDTVETDPVPTQTSAQATTPEETVAGATETDPVIDPDTAPAAAPDTAEAVEAASASDTALPSMDDPDTPDAPVTADAEAAPEVESPATAGPEAGSLADSAAIEPETPEAVTAAGELRGDRFDLEAFRKIVRELESGTGAYASALPEQLLSLGMSLQREGEHEEAVKVFKRGVHLARINNGLYSPEQIALLEREIASHVAMGRYDAADERQHYMYRVQMRSMEKGLTRAQAFMDQAQWQYNAYRLDLEGPGYPRLMSMWDLYRLALNDIVDREGQTSLSLMPPLHGMLLSQYLIGLHPTNTNGGLNTGDGLSAQQQASRFYAYRAQNDKKGRAVIQAMYDIQQANYGESSIEAADALVMMGDWLFWQGEREAALEVYGEAIAELVDAEVAQGDIESRFAEPVALPNYEGARALPRASDVSADTILLEFTVTEEGRVVDLERIDDNDQVSSGLANRLMRKLRKTRFRPQLAMGEPVTTEKISRAYVIQ